jgi:outer membrane protein OmpA-like peptidoglycan-associated protein
VPACGYNKKDVQVDPMGRMKLNVYSDLPKKEDLERATKQSGQEVMKDTAPLRDRYVIYYESGQWSLTENIARQIQHTISILNSNPRYKLEVLSFSDCQGDKEYNLKLSRMRMEEIMKLFFSNGVSEKQMIGKYFGESRPLNGCTCDPVDNYNCSSDEIKKNRRTEINILR